MLGWCGCGLAARLDPAPLPEWGRALSAVADATEDTEWSTFGPSGGYGLDVGCGERVGR